MSKIEFLFLDFVFPALCALIPAAIAWKMSHLEVVAWFIWGAFYLGGVAFMLILQGSRRLSE